MIEYTVLRTLPDGREVVVGEAHPMTDGRHEPRGPGTIEFVKASCRMVESFFRRCGLVVRHRILVHTPGAVFPVDVEP